MEDVTQPAPGAAPALGVSTFGLIGSNLLLTEHQSSDRKQHWGLIIAVFPQSFILFKYLKYLNSSSGCTLLGR